MAFNTQLFKLILWSYIIAKNSQHIDDRTNKFKERRKLGNLLDIFQNKRSVLEKKFQLEERNKELDDYSITNREL